MFNKFDPIPESIDAVIYNSNQHLDFFFLFVINQGMWKTICAVIIIDYSEVSKGAENVTYTNRLSSVLMYSCH